MLFGSLHLDRTSSELLSWRQCFSGKFFPKLKINSFSLILATVIYGETFSLPKSLCSEMILDALCSIPVQDVSSRQYFLSFTYVLRQVDNDTRGQFHKTLRIRKLRICSYGQILTINLIINCKNSVIYGHKL